LQYGKYLTDKEIQLVSTNAGRRDRSCMHDLAQTYHKPFLSVLYTLFGLSYLLVYIGALIFLEPKKKESTEEDQTGNSFDQGNG